MLHTVAPVSSPFIASIGTYLKFLYSAFHLHSFQLIYRHVLDLELDGLKYEWDSNSVERWHASDVLVIRCL